MSQLFQMLREMYLKFPGGRFPFGSNQPKLTYCSLPLMVTLAFGAESFTLPAELIRVGLNTLPLTSITVFIPPLLSGLTIGLLLELGGKDINLVRVGKPNGASRYVMVLLLRTKVTVCGSAVNEDGTFQTTVAPALISTFCGLYPKKNHVALPPPT